MKLKQKISVLGTPYEVLFRAEKDDHRLKNVGGYCDPTVKRIVVGLCEEEEDTVENLDEWYKTALRHELIHAFAFESGLDGNSSWALNEEMTAWVGNQFPKMLKAFQDAEAI